MFLSFFFEIFYAYSSTKVSQVENTENPVKLLTYNILQHWADIIGEGNHNLVLDVINKTSADIIGLQEAFGDHINGTVLGTSWLASKLGMYHFKTNNSDDHAYGVSLLSRWPITSQNYTMLREKKRNPFSRIVIQVTIDSPYGELNVFLTHLDTSLQNYAFQLKQVRTIINLTKTTRPTIIMGDFNAFDTLLYEPYRRLSTVFSDAWIASGKLAIEGRTWPAFFPIFRFDYIWLAGTSWSVVKGSSKLVGNPRISDHLGVYVEVEVSNT
jgi:endonuclease/exonuclease/phosphatase family metal-dependent hydrolase